MNDTERAEHQRHQRMKEAIDAYNAAIVKESERYNEAIANGVDKDEAQRKYDEATEPLFEAYQKARDEVR